MKRLLQVVAVLGVVWILAGVVAAFQIEGRYCATTMDTVSMVAWGPLSYVPHLEYIPGECSLPT